MSERLDRIEAMLLGMAERAAADREAANERMDRFEAGLAETRALCDSNARAIEALANQKNDDRDETINVKLDILERIAERDERLDATLLEMGNAINRLTMAVIGLLQRSA